jgi:hypothetical protein
VGLPMLARLVSREWAETGRFLARSIPDFYEQHPIGQVVEMWRGAGIGGVEVRSMSFGGGLVMWGTKHATLDTAVPDAVGAVRQASCDNTGVLVVRGGVHQRGYAGLP